ncbi:hypothetical protein [Tenggerimyces flavus]|uniref:Uncharacterized protein n=1 Tax=Tenggerimyces flavus TaxID=1708749 RepID=A0ABV7YPG4_9ACTN|nr:hypothetical protein [Tenggerimyces flavus]MBM7784465.1 hypothetical protein [Tenggerimyces flavus]
MRAALAMAGLLVMAACSGPSTVAEYAAEEKLEWTKGGRPVPGPGMVSHLGPEHCEWQSSTFLYVGTHTYLRDPENVVGNGFRAGLRQGIELPADARDTGLRAGALEVWLSPSDQGAFLRVGADVERWPRVDGQVGCG